MPKPKWESLIQDYLEHLGTHRCEDPEAIWKEINRLRKLQDESEVRAA